MSYTIAHLRAAHHIGSQGLDFEQTVELIELLERNGLSRLLEIKDEPVAKSILQDGASPTKKRQGRGQLADKIVGFLATKGEGGAHVSEIAKAVKVSPASIHVWLYRTGKAYLKSGQIVKVAAATFRAGTSVGNR